MDSILFFIIGGLFVVIIVEFFFMQWMIDTISKEKKQLLEELSRATKAVISKNANEYVMTAAIDKVPKEENPKPTDEYADMETLPDDQFDEAIGIKR